MLSVSEGNYIKNIYHLSTEGEENITTNAIAGRLKTQPASVTDMIRKLSDKKLVLYEKYKGVTLTPNGHREALAILRKERLWKVFLVEKLKFSWNEVNEPAYQLEHIHSPLLYSRLEKFLDYPKFDPHGDPIPDEHGAMESKTRQILGTMKAGESGILVSVNETDPVFLEYLDRTGMTIGCKIKIIEVTAYDKSMEIQVNDKRNLTISREVAANLVLSE